MATQYQPERPRSDASVRRNSDSRPTRPAASRFGEVPANRSRAAGTPSNPPRRRPRRKRKSHARLYALIALLAVVILAVIAFAVASGNKSDPAAEPTAVPVATADASETAQPSDDADAAHSESLAAMLGNSETELEGLSSDQMAKVDDLAINESLPSEWINILLLGSDERTLTESARTDSMIICSINTTSGEVKLTSIMRDLAIDYDEIGDYNGTYRINAANFFGGEELAMRVVNECFDMNIEYYVRVNFYGFQQIAQMLGGIEMDITQEEMEEINYRIVEQARAAYKAGIDESALPNEYLETYGENTHLDGRQTLAYARIRKLDGGDYARSERQRKVLVALMNKLKGSDAATLLSVANAALPHVKTNLSPDTILSIALKVLQSGLSDVESFRLPVNDSYCQETRDGQDMLYDCDWAKNASELYYFIYE